MRVPETVVLLCLLFGLLFFLFPLPSFNDESVEEQFSKTLGSFVANTPSSGSRVAISFNVCLDLIVRAVPLFNSLGFEKLPSGSLPADIDEVLSMSQTLQLFSLYHRQGSAVERHLADPVVFERLTNASKKLENAQYFAGGNAALMANGLAVRGSTVMLGGPVGEGVVPFLNPSIQIPETGVQWKDEIHLILEFQKDEKWNGIPSPRANRMILTHDINNINSEAVMKAFEEPAKKFNADMLVLTGLHALVSQDFAFREKHVLNTFETYRRIVGSRSIPIHTELASIGLTEYWKQLLRIALPRTHSIGLNEQELFSVYQAVGGNVYKYEDFTSPSPHLILSTIGYIFHATDSTTFQRVHFHCLHYHIVAHYSGNSKLLFPRDRAAASAVIGSYTATTNACAIYDQQNNLILSPEATRLFLTDTILVPSQLPSPSNPGLPSARPLSTDFSKVPYFHAEYDEFEFWIAPVMVCNSPKKTVGLGDSVSSAGVAYAL